MIPRPVRPPSGPGSCVVHISGLRGRPRQYFIDEVETYDAEAGARLQNKVGVAPVSYQRFLPSAIAPIVNTLSHTSTS